MKIKSDIFLKHININSKTYKFILFYGPNFGLVNLLFNNVIKTLSIDVNDPFNVSKYSTQDLIENPHIISDTISTFSMTSDRRIVLLDLCNTPLKKKVFNDLKLSVSKEINEYLIIIKADNLGAQNDFVKFAQESKFGIVVPCYDETILNVKFELSNILIEYNFKFSDPFLLHLSSKFSNDSSINKMEFDKLKNFLSNNETVSETILLNLITDNTNINLSNINNFCGLGDVKNALFFYNKILDSSVSSIVIIRSLVKHFQVIERILCAIHDGKFIDDAINQIKPPIFFKDKPLFSKQSKLWSLQKIDLILKRLLDTEIKCKSGLFSDKILTAQLILSISVIAKNAIRS